MLLTHQMQKRVTADTSLCVMCVGHHWGFTLWAGLLGLHLSIYIYNTLKYRAEWAPNS